MCIKARTGCREIPGAVFQSVLKNAWNKCAFESSRKFVFHPPGGTVMKRIYKDTLYSLHIIFNDPEPGTGNCFIRSLEKSLKESEENNTLHYIFTLQSYSACEKRTVEILQKEYGIGQNEQSLVLAFISPLNLKKAGKKARQWDISSRMLTDIFLKRIKNFFNIIIESSDVDTASLEVQPFYWQYTEQVHKGKSNKGNLLLNGYRGLLPLSGISREFLNLVIICSEIHAGERTSYGLGRFIIQKEFTYFDRKLIKKRFIQKVLDKMIEKNEGESEWIELVLDNGIGEMILSKLTPHYRHGDFTAFEIDKKSGGKRLIFHSLPVDQVIEKAAFMVLEPVWRRLWEKRSFGYIRGKGREDAKRVINKLILEGYLWVFESDIESFFDDLNRDVVLKAVKKILPPGDRIVYTVIAETLMAPIISGSVRLERNRGLPTGSPLSPLLANLVLDVFDEKMAEKGHLMIRYADDFIVMTKTREELIKAGADAREILAGLDLILNPEKTGIKSISDGFTFLGYDFYATGDPDLFTAKVLFKTLYIEQPGCFCGLEGDIITIKKGSRILARFPYFRVGEIIIIGNSAVSTYLLHCCSRDNIPVTFCSGKGYCINTLRPDSKAFYTLSGIHLERYRSLKESELLDIEKRIVTAKIENYLSFFHTRFIKENKSYASGFTDIIEKLGMAGSRDEIFGYEGAAGRIIFQLVNENIHIPFFTSGKRQRKNPDPLNSLINFGSYLLFTHCNALVRSAGLNPYLGFLHDAGDDYESLVCDLMEPFRFRVTRMILRVINRKQIKENSFINKDGSSWLKHDAVKIFIQAFEGELLAAIKDDPGDGKTLLKAQVLSVLNWVKTGSMIRIYRRHSP
ncbi:MAG: CRISPR-associated endonuclease Cas1 [Spirochaetales bacterium]|nr:CRISPR-associated endonuclease Cas1 [Spirochaetales bacterium]